MALSKITTESLLDGEITLAKLSSGTDGNIISYDASGNPVAIATGNDGQVLTSTGAGSPPAFEDAAGGSWNVIATAVADDDASVTLTGISATYASYCIAVCDVVPAADDKRFYMLTGNASTIADGSNYDYYLSGSSGTNAITYIYLMAEMGNAAGEGWSGMIWHNRPTTGNTQALFHFSGGSRNKDSSFVYAWGGGQKVTVETVDRVRFQTSGGNIASGRFTLYGIAHA